MRADDDAEVADGDLADVGKRRADFITHVLGVFEAVGISSPLVSTCLRSSVMPRSISASAAFLPRTFFATSSVPPSGTYSTGFTDSSDPTSAEAFDTRPPALG